MTDARSTLTRGDLRVVVDADRGSRIVSINHDGHEHLVTNAASTLDWGIYPMVPFAGRLRDGIVRFNDIEHRLPTNAGRHAIHGTVFDAAWSIDHLDATSIAMVTDIGEPWPFPARARHLIQLTDDTVRCELAITVATTSPVQVGWHPWFARPDHVHFDFASMLHKDSDGITTLERVEPRRPPVDDCFFEPNSWPRVGGQHGWLEIASDCPWWVRYDSPDGHVCIEPQSGPPNGINTKPLVLEAGGTFSRWMEIRIVDRAIV